MELKYYIYLLIMIACFKLGFCQRRISQGRFTPEGKKYVVYLINSIYSESQPMSWLCGGALISPTQVLTAAACLNEVSHIYVIAGYKKYVSAEHINDDECTKTKKNKIVTTVIPKDFHLDTWTKFDVGIGIVEKPYDFFDISYNVICSYIPGSILINFELIYERENLHTVVYGWGGKQAREPGRLMDINSRYMKEARTVITSPSFCSSQMTQYMESYYLCAYGTGFLTSDGRDVNPIVLYDNCATRRFSLNEDVTNECLDDDDAPDSRRSENNNSTNTIDKQTTNVNKNTSEFNDTRRQLFRNEPSSGICQNDHGGPLVTWVGKTEILIGIALNSLYTAKYECQGPFLYLSTARTKDLINCILDSHDDLKRRVCNARLLTTIITDIQWPEPNKNSKKKQIKRRQQQSQMIQGESDQKNAEYLIQLRPQAQIGDN